MAIINNNVQNVKFLRNGSVFTPSVDPVKTARQVALDAMELQKANLADGTAILGRYQETNGIVKTLVGFAYISGDTKTLTVFDVDGAGADVDAKILAAIQALDAEETSTDGTNVQVKVTEVDGKITAVNITTDNTVNSGDVETAIETEIGKLDVTDTAVNGQYVSQVSQADGKIAVTRVALPTVAAISETGKPITAVSESLGEISATAGTINAEFVNIADSGEKFTATTVEGALAEIAAEIDAMDLAVVSGDGEVITAVSEEDGKVSASKTAIKDVKLTGYVKDTTKTGNIAATDDIEDALSKLENKTAAITINDADQSINVTPTTSGTDISVNIKSGEHVLAKDGNAGIYTNISLSSITPSSTTVKEEYQLTATDGTKLGDTIKIYKDSSLYNVYLGHMDDTIAGDPPVVTSGTGDTALCFIYHKEDGTYALVPVNVESFLEESEFASGVTADSATHIVHGVVDPDSESFLTVGASGFKLAGVQNAIDTAVSGLDASVSAATTHVTVKVDEADGKLTAVTLTESDIANKTDLDTLSGKTVTAVEMTGGTAAISAHTDGTKKITINTDGSQIFMTGYDKGSDSGAVATGDSINVAIGKLENQIASKVDALDATVSGETADGKVKVQVVQENGVLTAVTVTGTDIASNSGLTAEIAARKAVDGQNGQTYDANSGKKFISGATSLNDADVALNDALENVDSKYVSGVTVNGKAVTISNHVAPISISPANGTGASATPIVINTDNNTGAVTIQLEGLDCGTY